MGSGGRYCEEVTSYSYGYLFVQRGSSVWLFLSHSYRLGVLHFSLLSSLIIIPCLATARHYVQSRHNNRTAGRQAAQEPLSVFILDNGHVSVFTHT